MKNRPDAPAIAIAGGRGCGSSCVSIGLGDKACGARGTRISQVWQRLGPFMCTLFAARVQFHMGVLPAG